MGGQESWSTTLRLGRPGISCSKAHRATRVVLQVWDGPSDGARTGRHPPGVWRPGLGGRGQQPGNRHRDGGGERKLQMPGTWSQGQITRQQGNGTQCASYQNGLCPRVAKKGRVNWQAAVPHVGLVSRVLAAGTSVSIVTLSTPMVACVCSTGCGAPHG